MAILATINDIQAATISGGGRNYTTSKSCLPKGKDPVWKSGCAPCRSNSVSNVSNKVDTFGMNIQTITTDGLKSAVTAGNQMVVADIRIG